MIEQQLQLGEVEQMDGQGNPVTKPADEQDMYQQSLAAPLPEQELGEYLDGTVDGTTDFTLDPLAEGVQPTDGQLLGAAEIYNAAMATNARAITPEDVREMTKRTITPFDVQQSLAGIAGQSKEQRQVVAYNLIADPRLQVEAKMDLIRYVDALGQEPDPLVVTKQAESQASTADYASDDEPDADDAWNMQQERIATSGSVVARPTDDSGNVVDPESVYADIKALYDQADDGESFLDYVEQMTPVGSLPAMNKVLADIYFDLGLTDPDVVGDEARPWLAAGTAFAELRGMIRAAEKNPAQKAEIARVIFNRLKTNTGVFQDNNDLVVMQVLENLFSKELFGEEGYQNEIPLTPAEEAELAELDKRVVSRISGEERIAAQKRRSQLIGKRGGTAGSTIIDNVFNIADVTFVGGLLRGVGRVGRKLPTLLERMSKTAPETAAKRAALAILDETGESAAALGTRPIDLAENFLATGADDVVINRGINGFAAMAETMQAQARALVKQLTPTNLTTAERAKALQDISEKYSPTILAKTRPVKLHLNQSSVQLGEDGATASVTAIFGATPYRGYATLGAARRASLEAAEEVFGKDAPVEIVQKLDDGTFRVVEAGEKAALRGEFFQRVRDTRSLASSETYGTIALADDAVDKLTLSSGASNWTRGLNIFNNFHYNQISARVRQSSFSNAVWRGLFTPLINLKTGEKQLLSKIIKENEGKELYGDALEMAAGGNKRIVEGYKRFNQIGNIAYHLEDQLKRTAYLREGLSDLYQNGQRIGFGKVLDEVEATGASRRKVFDPATGQYTTMMQADIQKLYRKGGSLSRMRHPVRGAENVEDALVVIDRTKGGRNLPIPAFGVQARIPGYYPHMYNRNFVVFAVDKAGKRIPKAVSFTQKSAQNFVARKNAQLATVQAKGRAGNLVRYEAGFDPALTKGDVYAQHLDEVESGFSQIMFGQRTGGGLKELDDWMEEAELDPIAAMLRATEILSTRITKGEMLQSMRQRAWNSLHLPENQKYLKPGAINKSYNQLTVDDLVETHPDLAGWKRHHAMLHRIRNMEMSPDFYEKHTKMAYRGMAQLSAKLGAKSFEKGAYGRAKMATGPVSPALGWLHRMYIVIPAVKQFTLQALQSFATAGMLSPTNYTKAVWQANSIVSAVILRTAQLHGGIAPKFLLRALDDGAFYDKAIGMSKKEFSRVVDVIITRGLIDSVGSNTMVKAAVNDAAEAYARKRARLPRKGVQEGIEKVRDSLGPLAPLTRLRTYDQAVFGTLGKLGWEGGERLNQILSFLTLYNRDKARGIAKLSDEAYVDDLIGRTAELTGNMVKEAGFGYTNSVLKPMMLWVPFQHKMILQAMPKSLGGMRNFTGGEAARMVFGQFLLYGSNATALTAAVHQVIERGIVERMEAAPEGEKNAFVQFWRDNISRQVLEGMVFDWMGNKTLQALYGNDATEPKDMAWGRAFAPGAGHEFVREKVTALASADVKGALGVQGNYYSKLTRYLNDVSNVVTARMKDMDDMPLSERMNQMVQRGLMDTVPMYGKWVTGRWAMAHGQFISENGTLSEPFGDAIEAKLQFVLGLESKDRAAYYEATDRLRMEFEDSSKATKAGEEVADIYWKNLVATAVKLEKETPTDEMWSAAMDQWMLDQGMMLSVLGPRELEVFNARVERNIDKLANGDGDSAELLMMEKFSRKLQEGGYGEDGPRAAVYFRHLPFVKDNPAFMDMLDSAWDSIVNEPTPENITQESVEGEE